MNNDNTFDVEIVGGGPAGSSAAIRLANAGLKTILIEQKKFPRAKLCGEFISPECLIHFEELGVMPSINSARGSDLKETVFYSRSGKGIAVKSEWFGNGATALGLSRAEMDQKLLIRAREIGVDVREVSTVNDLLFDDGRVIGVKVKEIGDVYSRLTIDATGRAQALARRIGKTEQRKKATHVAFKAHLKNAKVAAAACEIYAYGGGYGGCNRVENELYDLCFIVSADDAKMCGSDAERVMREVVFQNKRAKQTLQDAEVASDWLAVPIERFGRGRLVPATGLITVGDAAAFIDPFTGSGILMALESAKVAAESIIQTNREGLEKMATAYENAYSKRFDRRLRVCSLLRHAAFVPFLADTTIGVLNLSDGLLRRVVKATRFETQKV